MHFGTILEWTYTAILEWTYTAILEWTYTAINNIIKQKLGIRIILAYFIKRHEFYNFSSQVLLL